MERPAELTIDRIKMLLKKHAEKTIWVWRECQCKSVFEINGDHDKMLQEQFEGCHNCGYNLSKTKSEQFVAGTAVFWDDQFVE